MVSDQYGSPTSAADLAETILRISNKVQQGASIDWGTYHYCGQGIISWHDFAQAIVDICRQLGKVKTTRVDPIKTADYPTRVERPPYSALDCTLINKHFGITPKPWQNSVAITIHELLTATLKNKLQGGMVDLPDNQMESFVIGQLQGISWRNKIELMGVRPGKGSNIQALQEVLFDVEISGDYFDLYAWLQELDDQLGFVVIKSFTIRPLDTSLTGPRLIARLTIVSYPISLS